MLRSLIIENVALIEHADVEFTEGLNVLSGETGAGKSVILDCIDFVLGAKADKSMVRYGAPACSVRAEFSYDSEEIDGLLSELDAAGEGTVVISRKLTADGKGSLRLNGCPVTVAMLRRVTSHLVDVHGQSEHFFLLKESNQLKLLDSVAGESVRTAKGELSSLLSRRREILAELQTLGGDEGERNRRLDILRFQIDEIERADMKSGEKEELLSKREKFRNAEKIGRGLSEARDALLSDGGAVDLVRTAARALQSVSKFSEEYEALLQRMEDASAELSDLGEGVESEADGLEMDEREAERVEERIDEIRSLEKKYGGSYEEIEAFLQRAREDFELLSDSGERAEALKTELKTLDDKLYSCCVRLDKGRREAALQFTARVTEELKTLNIPSAVFEVRFDPFTREDVSRATQEGLGGVCFLFSANKGEPPKELSKVISGGEMSRFMLAVKARLSSLWDIGTYLFDEIDSGIGGKTARVVAETFCKISRSVQVIAVSHLAQVSAYADSAFLIEKTESGGRAFTNIVPLENGDRVREIARLAGGDTESEHALLHAEEMLVFAADYKKSLNG